MDFHAITWSDFFFYISPPLVAGLHGWGATAMAIWALFHPYKPFYIGTWQIPLTPGIFPKQQIKLSRAVAATVTDTLLTASDLRNQAEKLVTEQSIYLVVDALFDAVLKEFRDAAKLHRLAQDLAELSPAILQELVVATIDGVESGRSKNIAQITEKIFDEAIMKARLSKQVSQDLAARMMEAVLTPVNIRMFLISLLSPNNIQSLDHAINSHAGGGYKILAKLIGVKRVCYEWRNFLEKEPEEAHKIITELLKEFEIEAQLAQMIASKDLQSLPMQTVARLRSSAIKLVEEFIVQHRQEILSVVRHMQGEAMSTVQSAIIRLNTGSVPAEWLERVKLSVASFFYGYVKTELGVLVERAIRAFGVEAMITTKIDHFTPQQLEDVVKRICRQELKYLEYGGAVIGTVLGFVQIGINILGFSSLKH